MERPGNKLREDPVPLHADKLSGEIMPKQLDFVTETTPAPESLIRRLADSDNPNSFANRMRSRRFQLFEAAIASCPRPVHILDVGGTNEYWERRGWAGRDDIQVVTLNIKADEQLHDNI